jgi:hypothetical protein
MKDFARRLFPPDLMALALVIGLSVDCIIQKGVHAVKTGVSPRTSRTRTKFELVQAMRYSTNKKDQGM